MSKIIEHNAETGEIIERDMTAEEIKQQEKDVATAQADKVAKEAKAAAKQALLDKLGISVEEARLLLG
jgi:hypothetical protein